MKYLIVVVLSVFLTILTYSFVIINLFGLIKDMTVTYTLMLGILNLIYLFFLF